MTFFYTLNAKAEPSLLAIDLKREVRLYYENSEWLLLSDVPVTYVGGRAVPLQEYAPKLRRPNG